VPCQIGGLVDGRPEAGRLVTGRGLGGLVGGSPDSATHIIFFVFSGAWSCQWLAICCTVKKNVFSIHSTNGLYPPTSKNSSFALIGASKGIKGVNEGISKGGKGAARGHQEGAGWGINLFLRHGTEHQSCCVTGC
jgi:hypothetical protein